MNKYQGIKLKKYLTLISVLFFAMGLLSQHGIVDFDSGSWILTNAHKKTHLGRKCVAGMAYLKDVSFQNGVIEVDIAVDGNRSYPGVFFRMQSFQNYENFYIRPHRSRFYPDALQYTPVTNGIGSWQLYNGDGFTGSAQIPPNQWIHLKIEISGKQARVYFNDMKKPALKITDLKHGISKGTIGISGPRDGTAYFSNFQYKLDDHLTFGPAPIPETPPGMITKWQVSKGLKLSQIDLEKYPHREILSTANWQTVESEHSGLVDIARFRKRMGREPDCVLAKVTIHADDDRVKKLLFGYSDAISIFLNEKLLFFGNSAYRLRDPSFLGIVGLNDIVYLPLKKGDNELLLIIAESFGGWGFICQDGNAVFQHESLKKIWEKEKGYRMPESIIYDNKRKVLYISNFDSYGRPGKQFISKLTPDSKIENLEWISGLTYPTGMAIFKNKLFVVERRNIVEVGLESGIIEKRHPVPQPMFLNDIAVDRSGKMYISDSSKNLIYRFNNGQFEEWFKGNEIQAPNGLCVHDNHLIVGNSGDNCLKSINLTDKKVKTIVNFGPGIIDGIKIDKKGNYLVSIYQGKLYRISQEGKVIKLLDTTAPKLRTADFEYISTRNLIVIPGLETNKITAYYLENQ